MADKLDEVIARLVAEGVDPRLAMPAGATITKNYVGFRAAHLVASFVAGAVAIAGAGGLWMMQTGHWVAARQDQTLVRAVALAGVDVTLMSVGDLRARLSLDPAAATALATSLKFLPPQSLTEMGARIMSLPPESRRSYVSAVAEMEAAIGPDGEKGKYVIVKALSRLTAVEADVLAADPGVLIDIFSGLAMLSGKDRRRIATARFPIVPLDDDRATMFAAINDPGFPGPLMYGVWSANPQRRAEMLDCVINDRPPPAKAPAADETRRLTPLRAARPAVLAPLAREEAQ